MADSMTENESSHSQLKMSIKRSVGPLAKYLNTRPVDPRQVVLINSKSGRQMPTWRSDRSRFHPDRRLEICAQVYMLEEHPHL